MKQMQLPRFDVAALQELAGAKAYRRGEEYYRDGHVRIIAVEPKRVLAQVSGTEDYRTEVTGRGKAIGGDCSCPAFEDWGFCKHMVAVALAANAGDGTEAAETGAMERIRAHLKAKGIDALVTMIADLAERDTVLFRKLDLAAAAFSADDKTLEVQLRKALDDATKIRGYIDYGQAPGWAAGVGEALDVIGEFASGPRAGLVFKLMERAFTRIEEALGSIDDSNGYCGGLLERARDIHLLAASTLRPQPLEFARQLYARELGEDYDTFYGAADIYAEVLGQTGLAEYRRLASQAWDKLPSRAGGGRRRTEPEGNYHQLRGILDYFAARDSDVEARIALRAKDLSDPGKYLQLADFCLAQGRPEEALRRAEEGLWLFEDDQQNERLLIFTADLLARAGRFGEAEAHLWRAFVKAPGFELYGWLGKTGGDAARARAVAYLESWLAKQKDSGWHNPADLFVNILIDCKAHDAAWTILRKRKVSMNVKMALARASEASHPRQSADVYVVHIEELVNLGGNGGYAGAAALAAHLASLRGAAEQAAYMADLKLRHARKRNFMKLLA